MPVSRSDSPAPINPAEGASTPLFQAVESQDPRYLLNTVKNLMRTRQGSVLTRNTILKMDHFEKGKRGIVIYQDQLLYLRNH